ncbi:MAG: PEP/pyruvate-binding domain-containing protein, partial [Patescibacteria group bacterium]
MSSAQFVSWFAGLSKEDVGSAGGKGANLGELTNSGVPVPPGFVVLAKSYFTFLEENNLRPQIHKILSVCDINDPHQLA